MRNTPPREAVRHAGAQCRERVFAPCFRAAKLGERAPQSVTDRGDVCAVAPLSAWPGGSASRPAAGLAALLEPARRAQRGAADPRSPRLGRPAASLGA